jgi:hypothetical protein
MPRSSWPRLSERHWRQLEYFLLDLYKLVKFFVFTLTNSVIREYFYTLSDGPKSGAKNGTKVYRVEMIGITKPNFT